MMTVFEDHLRKQNLNRLTRFLDRYDHSEKFSACKSFDEVMELFKRHSSLFNLRLIKQATKGFDCEAEVCEKVIEEYCFQKNTYCRNTSIRNFEHTSSWPSSKSKVCVCGGSSILVKCKISAAMEREKTVEDIVKCAKGLFGDFYNHLSEMNRAHYKSQFVTWNLPMDVASDAVRRAKAHLNILNEYGVDKVTILEDVDLFSFEMVYTIIYTL